MKPIKLSDALEIRPEIFATQGNAVLGIRGTGKTTSTKVLVEWLIDNDIPNVIFDPTSVWKHMKTSAPEHGGKGFDVVVAGGADSDLPLTTRNAGDIMRACMKGRINIVFDLKPFDEPEQHHIVQAAVKVLFRENDLYGIRNIVFEEASEFCAQDPGSKEEFATMRLISRAVKLGGNFSLGVTLVAQRAEDVNKKALNNCSSLFLHAQRGSQSLQAIEKWMRYADKENANKITTDLTTLPPGACYIWTGHNIPERVQMPRSRSFHPDRQKPVISTQLKQPADVSKWVEKLKSMLPANEVKTGPIHEKSIAPREIIKEVEKIVEVQVLKDSDAALLTNVLDAVRDMKAQIVAFESQLVETKMRLEKITLRPRQTQTIPPTKFTPAKTFTPNPKATSAQSDSESIQGGLRRMMIALAQRPGINAAQLGIRAGLSSSSGTFGTYLGKGRSNGWIAGERDSLTLTDEGLSALGEYDELPTGQALLDYWLNELEGGARRMLEALAEAYPNELTADEVGEKAGISHTSGTFGTYLGKLRTLELVTGKRDGLAASAEFFE